MINETNLTKLAFVLAANGGGSGSGSSSGGGGVMAIGYDMTTLPPRLDKTWQEIYDCVSGGALPVLMRMTAGENYAAIAYIDSIEGIDDDMYIYAHTVENGQVQSFTYMANSPSDYPVLSSADGGGGLVVTINEYGTFDKTWQEIYDAMAAGKSVYGLDGQVQDICVISGAYVDGTKYCIAFGSLTYSTDSPDGYPSNENAEG